MTRKDRALGIGRVGALTLAIAFAAASSGHPSIAQSLPASATPSNESEIVVEGHRRSAVRRYVENVAKPLPGHQLARWNAPLCVKLDGFAAPFEAKISERISRAATTAGLAVAPSGCTLGVLIKLTNDSDGLARALTRRRPRRIGAMTSDQPLSDAQIKAIEEPRTIRWMAGSATVTRDGLPVDKVPTAATSISDVLTSAHRTYSSSLIRTETREDLASKIILVDAERLAGVTLNQLADYLAFVTIAAPDLASDYSGMDSIMSLFGKIASEAPVGLTRQDQAYLRAMYSIPADREFRRQLRTLTERVSSTLSSPSEE